MPKRLIAVAPRVAELLFYEKPTISSDEVLIEVNYATPKHGTDLTDFRGGSPWETEVYNGQTHLFEKRPEGQSGVPFGTWNLGNMVVGHIIEVGNQVKDYHVGDRVCTYGGIAEYVVAKGVNNHRLRKMKATDSWENAVCYDPMQYALGGIRDAHVRPGDEVMVFGLGAIGLLAVAIAHQIGATVIAVDPLENRRGIALHLGARVVLDPTKDDVGHYVKTHSNYGGCDAIIETSGSPYALQQALRGLAYGGTIAYVAFAKEFKGGLNFGKEAHFNNPKIVFSRAANEPNYDYPRWDRKRIEEVSWSMLMSHTIDCKQIITPVISMDHAADGYMRYVDQEPNLSIKLGIVVKEDSHVTHSR